MGKTNQHTDQKHHQNGEAQKLLEGELPLDAEIAVLQDQYGLEEDLVSGKLFESKERIVQTELSSSNVSLPRREPYFGKVRCKSTTTFSLEIRCHQTATQNLKKLLRLWV